MDDALSAFLHPGGTALQACCRFFEGIPGGVDIHTVLCLLHFRNVFLGKSLQGRPVRLPERLRLHRTDRIDRPVFQFLLLRHFLMMAQRQIDDQCRTARQNAGSNQPDDQIFLFQVLISCPNDNDFRYFDKIIKDILPNTADRVNAGPCYRTPEVRM